MIICPVAPDESSNSPDHMPSGLPQDEIPYLEHETGGGTGGSHIDAVDPYNPE